ncbi:hypothetical protein BDV06DRAFT_201579 [Aspergillus oleicola]
MGAYDEVDNTLRVELIEQIAECLGGKLLADMDKLEAYIEWFIAGPKSSRYNLYTNRSWTRALKIWTTRERIKDKNKKCKFITTTLNLPTPLKIPRRAESVGRATKDIRSLVALPSRGRSPLAKSRFKSPLKIIPALAIPTKLSTPSTLTSPGVNCRDPKDYLYLIAIADNYKKRDKYSCLVTWGGDYIKTAYIYPFSLGTKVGNAGYKEFWDRLSIFWLLEKIRDWEDIVLGRERMEILPNLMPRAHLFHWLQDLVYELRDLRTPPANPAKLDGTTRQTRLINCATKSYICSGDILTFTTEDPEKWLLPSVHLLHMQWVLNRLVALAGAVDVTDEELDPDNPTGLASLISVGDAREADLPEEADDT